MTDTASIRLQATVLPGNDVSGKIAEWTGELEASAAARDLDPETMGKISIAVDELLMNLACHGAPQNGKAEIAVECLVETTPSRAAVTFRDDAMPFDPRSLPKPEFGGDPMETRIGGLGVAMLFELFDSLDYRRENGWNESRWETARL